MKLTNKIDASYRMQLISISCIFILITQNLLSQIVGGFSPGEMTPQSVKPTLPTAGTVNMDVNLFNGELQVRETLGTVSTPNGLSFTLNMSYSHVQAIGGSPNSMNGIPYGHGWNLDLPYVKIITATEHRQETSNPNTPPNFSAQDGDNYWYYLDVHIPGVASGPAMFKYIDRATDDENLGRNSGACFIPEEFETYVEFWVNGGKIKAVLPDGTTYYFDTPKISYSNPQSERHLSYSQIYEQLEEFSSSIEQDIQTFMITPELNVNYHVPKAVPIMYYVSRISNRNTLEGIEFYYDSFGCINYFQEYAQPTMQSGGLTPYCSDNFAVC